MTFASTAEDETVTVSWTTGIGHGKVWVKPADFRAFYNGVAERGEYPAVWFRAFGINNWYYTTQLNPSGATPIDAFRSGYCVLMRSLAVERIGIKLSPMKGKSAEDLRKAIDGMLELYLADPKLNFGNTLAIGKATLNPAELGAADLFAAFCLRLCKENGGPAFNAKLWQEVGKRPEAKSVQCRTASITSSSPPAPPPIRISATSSRPNGAGRCPPAPLRVRRKAGGSKRAENGEGLKKSRSDHGRASRRAGVCLSGGAQTKSMGRCVTESRSARKLGNSCAPCPRNYAGTSGGGWKPCVTILRAT